ncbi:hypothetical protein HYALB_00003388 [Hymenoscyphus albidus]|uniref:Zn(2)-C6 fungal-type domain-containing protein n=1 Tax=Hymenoscyphus albidus TaxID=595503 RepID=A0A9N9LRA9_9HELO|nr:hypothetical protein HYALB_00003388 [Hymenoscyphus albidus]
MVYGGKLSKDCEPCRVRRAKCDLVQPVCGQCSRASRACHGYRDTRELRIADMSALVAKKVKKESPPESRRKTRTGNGSPTTVPNNASNKTTFLGLPNPTDTIEDHAFSFFHSNFVGGKSCPFKYIEPIYGTMGLPLIMSIRAVGLASLSKAHRSTDLELRAQCYYISAISLINKALATPQATNEAIISSIMLLDQFDRIILPVHRSTQGWINHLNGAMALMKLRGPQQFTTQTGIEIFVHMRAHLFITCLQHKLPVPANYLKLHENASTYLDNIASEMADVTIRFVTFLTSIWDGSLSDTEEIIRSATKADQEVASLIAKVSSEESCRIVPLSFHSDLVYESYYTLYRDPTIGKILNQMQAARVALLDLILHQCEVSRNPLSRACQAMVQDAEVDIIRLMGAICASVPQQVGYLPLLDPNFASVASARIPSMPSTQRIRVKNSYAQSANVLLWPLFVAANARSCPERAKTWIINQFRIIGNTPGLDRALEAVIMLESGEHNSIWDPFWYVESISYMDDGRAWYGDEVIHYTATPQPMFTHSNPPSGRRVVFPCLAIVPFACLD